MAKLDNDDLKAIKDLIEVTVEDVVERKGVATIDHIGHLPKKDEFYGTMDKVMGELKAIRKGQAVQSHLLSDHGDRIDRIESRAGISSD
jgi:hypothetical protein